jgi:hypothetical protein
MINFERPEGKPGQIPVQCRRLGLSIRLVMLEAKIVPLIAHCTALLPTALHCCPLHSAHPALHSAHTMCTQCADLASRIIKVHQVKANKS